ncbi:MAG: aliphatic sulfonates family transporter, periplasmic ligand-binding protein [Actinomycetia bacterium]|nr:aliphatic sulfonates family transporter, periplasmic ligand-binding protein [Actinomycetes bacterium]
MAAMSHRRRLLPLLIALSAALLLAACGSDGGSTSAAVGAPAAADAATDLSGVTLRVGDQANLAKTLLEASGQGADLPYDIEWSTFAAGPPLLEAVNAGAVDIGGVGDAPPIFAAAGGAGITIVGASTSKDPEQSAQAIVVPKGSPIRTVGDLKGKRVAVAEGSSAHWLLLATLKDAGLTFDDIQPKYLLPPDGLAAFSGGDVDAWAIWDPFLSLAEQKQGGTILTNGVGLVRGFSFQVARTKALADPKLSAAIDDYLGRLAKANEWAIGHKEAWAAKYAELTTLPLPIVTTTLKRFEAVAVPIDDDVIAAEQEEADAFAEAGLIPKHIDIASIVDDRLKEASK